MSDLLHVAWHVLVVALIWEEPFTGIVKEDLNNNIGRIAISSGHAGCSRSIWPAMDLCIEISRFIYSFHPYRFLFFGSKFFGYCTFFVLKKSPSSSFQFLYFGLPPVQNPQGFVGCIFWLPTVLWLCDYEASRRKFQKEGGEGSNGEKACARSGAHAWQYSLALIFAFQENLLSLRRVRF